MTKYVYCGVGTCDNTAPDEGQALAAGWRAVEGRTYAREHHYCPAHPYGEPPYTWELVAVAGPGGGPLGERQTLDVEHVTLGDWLASHGSRVVLVSDELGDSPGSLYRIELRDAHGRLVDSYTAASS